MEENNKITSKEFIKQELNKLIIKFPVINFRYEYDELSDTNFIEVLPYSVYHTDKKYIALESDLIDEFIELFPYESICFISEDSIVKIENSILELEGENYKYLLNNNTD